MMTKTEKKRKIDSILRKFNFVKVGLTMAVLGRKWYDTEKGDMYSPSTDDLTEKARELLSMAIDNIDKPMHTFCYGGMEACVGDNGAITLRYIVEECYEEVCDRD